MEDRIHVEPAALDELKRVLSESGENYKSNLKKLKNFISEITRGDIEGPVADALVTRFQDREADFKAIADAIDAADEKVGIKGTKYTEMVDELTEKNPGGNTIYGN